MSRRLVCRLGLSLMLLVGTTFAVSAAEDTIDFEDFGLGDVVTEAYGQNGTGPVFIQGTLPGCPYEAAVIFDTSMPTGGDDDLGSPNETCDPPGPGVGEGGEVGAMFENCVPRGNVLIVHEQCDDLEFGGPVLDPDDADVGDEPINFDFSEIAPVEIKSIILMDVEADEPQATVKLFGAGDAPLFEIGLGPVGDNGVGDYGLGPTTGVYRMEVILNGSGAIDNIVFEPEPRCGDGNIDPGETCDPPGEPAGEPNECRDDCTFCGDGFLDEGEECDDGNNENGDGCDAYCMDEPFCGDGNIDPGETCDPPGEPAGEPNECREDCTFCGDGILDEGEECDDGNNIDGDGCDAYCMDEPMGGEGCTPGYWKVPVHMWAWAATGYSPGDLFDSVFGVDAPGDDTLLSALWDGGGGETAFQRHAVAALLNASSPDVAYYYSTAQVIAIVQNAYATDDFSAKDDFEAQNEDDTLCPLGNGRNAPEPRSRLESSRATRAISTPKSESIRSFGQR